MSYTIQIISYDGKNTFTVYGPGQGDRGIVLLQDPKGLIDAPIKSNWRPSVYGVGAKPTGVTYPPRDVHLIFAVIDDHSPEGWRATESAFRRAWSELYDSTIRIVDEYGILDLKGRLLDAPIVDNKIDPGLPGLVKTKYSVRCGNPNFQQEPEKIEWHFDGRNFYDTITISNPTDLPLWPQWVLPSPTSVVLPDKDFVNDQDHWVTMPFQFPGQDVLVDTRPDVEEAVCAGHAMWLGAMPDHFLNPIPPHTRNLKLPIIMNPFPFVDDVMSNLGIPTRMPHRFIVETAKALSGELSTFTPEAINTFDVGTLSGKIRAAVEQAHRVVGDAVTTLVAKLTAATIGQLIQATYKTVPSLSDQTIQLILPYEYSRPWGMGRE